MRGKESTDLIPSLQKEKQRFEQAGHLWAILGILGIINWTVVQPTPMPHLRVASLGVHWQCATTNVYLAWNWT
jgi:hypothetical protein